ncbi:hypothetical protein [Pseudoalteromonas distincta]|uniref:Uncharacterized protein n=1 Tax=Pseudoalteromonas distincta TaxID=77608 RepID=A0A4P9J0A6_9GAMM|nr:hypothetical protein [Pseudoalteromonas distincta]KAA1161532.1 hypothetical protein EU511_08320 [Pseudoalteromonas distincta]QCU74137.1 hypothetical protein FFU37_06520 [Pseudoalteromonas distincta]
MSDTESKKNITDFDDKWFTVFLVPFIIVFPKYSSIFPENFSSIAAAGILGAFGGLLGIGTYLLVKSKPIWVKVVALVMLLLPTFYFLQFV